MLLGTEEEEWKSGGGRGPSGASLGRREIGASVARSRSTTLSLWWGLDPRAQSVPHESNWRGEGDREGRGGALASYVRRERSRGGTRQETLHSIEQEEEVVEGSEDRLRINERSQRATEKTFFFFFLASPPPNLSQNKLLSRAKLFS